MTASSHSSPSDGSIAVYCGSSTGTQVAYSNAARSVGNMLAREKRPLVYGGGSNGLMGIVSSATLEGGGEVTGVVPFAIHAAGGERDKASDLSHGLHETSGGATQKKAKIVLVNSMHERKVEMARRVVGFIGLPGGFGTFEEILEVTTWTQLGIHNKPVVVLNVLGFFNPLRSLIQNAVDGGYIKESNSQLVVFVDGPASYDEHEAFDWGTAGLKAVQRWNTDEVTALYDWDKRMDGTINKEDGNLGAS